MDIVHQTPPCLGGGGGAGELADSGSAPAQPDVVGSEPSGIVLGTSFARSAECDRSSASFDDERLGLSFAETMSLFDRIATESGPRYDFYSRTGIDPLSMGYDCESRLSIIVSYLSLMQTPSASDMAVLRLPKYPDDLFKRLTTSVIVGRVERQSGTVVKSFFAPKRQRLCAMFTAASVLSFTLVYPKVTKTRLLAGNVCVDFLWELADQVEYGDVKVIVLQCPSGLPGGAACANGLREERHFYAECDCGLTPRDLVTDESKYVSHLSDVIPPLVRRVAREKVSARSQLIFDRVMAKVAKANPKELFLRACQEYIPATSASVIGALFSELSVSRSVGECAFSCVTIDAAGHVFANQYAAGARIDINILASRAIGADLSAASAPWLTDDVVAPICSIPELAIVEWATVFDELYAPFLVTSEADKVIAALLIPESEKADGGVDEFAAVGGAGAPAYSLVTVTTCNGEHGAVWHHDILVPYEKNRKSKLVRIHGTFKVEIEWENASKDAIGALLRLALETNGYQLVDNVVTPAPTRLPVVCQDHVSKIVLPSMLYWYVYRDVIDGKIQTLVTEDSDLEYAQVVSGSPFHWSFASNFDKEVRNDQKATVATVVASLQSGKSAWYSSKSDGRAYVYTLDHTSLVFEGYRTEDRFVGVPHIGLSRPLFGLLGGMEASGGTATDVVDGQGPGIQMVGLAHGGAGGPDAPLMPAPLPQAAPPPVQPAPALQQIANAVIAAGALAGALRGPGGGGDGGGGPGRGGGGGGGPGRGGGGAGGGRAIRGQPPVVPPVVIQPGAPPQFAPGVPGPVGLPANPPMTDLASTAPVSRPYRKAYVVIPARAESMKTAYQKGVSGMTPLEKTEKLDTYIAESLALQEQVLRSSKTRVLLPDIDLPFADDQQMPYLSTPVYAYPFHNPQHAETGPDDVGLNDALTSVDHGTHNVYSASGGPEIGDNFEISECAQLSVAGVGTYDGYQRTDRSYRLELQLEEELKGDYSGNLMTKIIGTSFTTSLGNWAYSFASAVGMMQSNAPGTYTAFLPCLYHHQVVSLLTHRFVAPPALRIDQVPTEEGFVPVMPMGGQLPANFYVNCYYMSSAAMNMLMNPTQRTPLNLPLDPTWVALRAKVMSGSVLVVKLPTYPTPWHTLAAFVSAAGAYVTLSYEATYVRYFEDCSTAPVGVITRKFAPYTVVPNSWVAGATIATIIFCTGGESATLGPAQDGGPAIFLPHQPGVPIFEAGQAATDPTAPIAPVGISAATFCNALNFARYGTIVLGGLVMNKDLDQVAARMSNFYIQGWNELFGAYVPAREYLDAMRVSAWNRFRCHAVMSSTYRAEYNAGAQVKGEVISGGSVAVNYRRPACSMLDPPDGLTSNCTMAGLQAAYGGLVGFVNDNTPCVSCYGIPVAGHVPVLDLAGNVRALRGEVRTNIACKRQMGLFQWVCATTGYLEPTLSAAADDCLYMSALGAATRFYKYERVGGRMCAAITRLYPVPYDCWYSIFDSKRRTPPIANYVGIGSIVQLAEADLTLIQNGQLTSDSAVLSAQQNTQAKMLLADNSGMGAGPSFFSGTATSSNSYVVYHGGSAVQSLRTSLSHHAMLRTAAGLGVALQSNLVAPAVPIFGDDYGLSAIDGEFSLSLESQKMNRELTSIYTDPLLFNLYATTDIISSRVAYNGDPLSEIDLASAYSAYLWSTLIPSINVVNPPQTFGATWGIRQMPIRYRNKFLQSIVYRAGGSALSVAGPTMHVTQGMYVPYPDWHADWRIASGSTSVAVIENTRFRRNWVYRSTYTPWLPAGIQAYFNASILLAALAAFPANQSTYINFNKGTKTQYIGSAVVPTLYATVRVGPPVSLFVPGVSARTSAAATYATATATGALEGFALEDGELSGQNE